MESSRTMKPMNSNGGDAAVSPLLIRASVIFTLISVASLIIVRFSLPETYVSSDLFMAIFVLFEIIRMCTFFGIFSIRWLTRNFEADLQTFIFAYAALGALIFSLFRLAFDVGSISASQEVSDSPVANYFTYSIVIFLLMGFLIASFVPPTRKISVPEQKRFLGFTIALTIGIAAVLLMSVNQSDGQSSLQSIVSLAVVPLLIWGARIFWRNGVSANNRSFLLISVAVIMYIPALFADAMTVSSNDTFRVISNFFGTVCPLILFIAITGESIERPYSRLKHLRDHFNQEMKELDRMKSEAISAQSKLDETERKFQRLMEIANEGIMINNPDMTIIFANPRMAGMLGYETDELVGMHLLSLLDDESRRQLQSRLDNRAGAFEEYELEYVKKDGHRINAIVGSSPIIDERGRYQGAIAVISEITKRKQMELSLQDERDKAQAYFDFLAHDMANILSPILIYSEMLDTDPKTPADMRFKLGKILEQSQRAHSLIQTLRKLEDMGKVPLDQVGTIDLRTVMSAVEDTVREEYPAKRFTIDYDIPKLERISVRGGEWVDDVLYEVVVNAVKHSSKHPVEIRIKVAPVTDGSGRSLWQVEISDNGPGIDDKQKELLAVPLTVTKRDFKGVGSSLPLCSSILQSLGGSLMIEDRIPGSPGEGTKIVIKLVEG